MYLLYNEISIFYIINWGINRKFVSGIREFFGLRELLQAKQQQFQQ